MFQDTVVLFLNNLDLFKLGIMWGLGIFWALAHTKVSVCLSIARKSNMMYLSFVCTKLQTT